MANNYTTLSYTLRDKDGKPPTLGPVGRALFHGFNGWFDETVGLGVVDQSDSLDSFYVAEVIRKVFPDSDPEQPVSSILMAKAGFPEEIAKAFDLHPSDDFLSLADVYALVKNEAGSTLASLFWEEGWWCDKIRHGNFGGHGEYMGRHVGLFGGSGYVERIGEVMDKALDAGDAQRAADILRKEFLDPVFNSMDAETREKVRVALAAALAAPS